MLENILVFFLYYLEESFLLVFCSLALLGIYLSFPRLVIIAIIDAIACFFVRYYVLFNLPFGSHTIVLFCLLVVLYRFLARITWEAGFTAALLGYLLISLSEIAIALPLLAYFQISTEQALQNPWLHIAFGWATDAFLLIIALFCYLKKFKILDLSDKTIPSKKSRY